MLFKEAHVTNQPGRPHTTWLQLHGCSRMQPPEGCPVGPSAPGLRPRTLPPASRVRGTSGWTPTHQTHTHFGINVSVPPRACLSLQHRLHRSQPTPSRHSHTTHQNPWLSTPPQHSPPSTGPTGPATAKTGYAQAEPGSPTLPLNLHPAPHHPAHKHSSSPLSRHVSTGTPTSPSPSTRTHMQDSGTLRTTQQAILSTHTYGCMPL